MRNSHIIFSRALSLMCALVLSTLSLYAQSDSTTTDTPAHEPAATTPSSTLWDMANTAYINAEYHQAVEIYTEILNQGLGSAKLYYNLGNAYFKDNNVGKAILFYNRALRLTPGNDDIRYNLEVAEVQTKDKIDIIPEFFVVTWLRTLRHIMGCTAWSVISLSALVLMLSLALLYLLATRLSIRKAGFYGTIFTMLIFIATTWFAVSERNEILNISEAIVMSTSVSAKSSPDNSSTDMFVIHEGTKVDITDRLDNWCEIVLADGKKGWVESRQIEVI